ncbi:MAG: ubiquitin-like small modifier protein 1 [archaeon]
MEGYWKLFATLRETVERHSISLEVAENATVAEALRQLFTEYPDLADRARANGDIRADISVVYEEITVDVPEEADRSLSPGDELPLLPPLSGG